MNVLFICSRNKCRSPTAETIFKNSLIHTARSAGTSEQARIKVNENLIEWADLIFVMEKRHKEILSSKFKIDKKIIILDISDDYQYMDEELISMISDGVAPYLE